MSIHEEILSFIDLLDLDEELIDSRLNVIINRTSCTEKSLKNVIHLLKYKQLINLQEESECDNSKECDFVARLITDLNDNNVDLVCLITNIVLRLNPSTIVSKSEHIIQQIFSGIDELTTSNGNDVNIKDNNKYILNFKIIGSILDANLATGEKLNLLFVETPLENVLFCTNERLKTYFLTSFVPKVFKGIIGYNILDRIWNSLRNNVDNRHIALKVLSCLSDFYLPTEYENLSSDLVLQKEFWTIVLHGMLSNDSTLLKSSIYLSKRAIDVLINSKININLKLDDEPLFFWKSGESKKLKNDWDNFFILMETLEEKQSNIVLPSLQLFETFSNVPTCWLNCAFNIALKHDNNCIRLQCLEYRLRLKVNNKDEALIILEALNDIVFYESEYNTLKDKVFELLQNGDNLKYVLRAFPSVKWSPVPFYHLSTILAKLQMEELPLPTEEITNIIMCILKIPCNIIQIRNIIYYNISLLIFNTCKKLDWSNYVNIYTAFDNEFFEKYNITNPLYLSIKDNLKNNDTENEFLNKIMESYTYIDLGLLYVDTQNNDKYRDLINDYIRKVQDIVNRQYADKLEVFNEVVYILHVYLKTLDKESSEKGIINIIIGREIKTIVMYILSLLTIETVLSKEDINLIFKGLDVMFDKKNDNDHKDLMLNLYKAALLILKDTNSNIDKRVLSLHIIANLNKNKVLLMNSKHELIGIKEIVEVAIELSGQKNKGKESKGKINNMFYEKAGEMMYDLSNTEENMVQNFQDIVKFVNTLLDCGGYGCLKWTLKIIIHILPKLLNSKEKFDLVKFMNRTWKEIEELKSNNQYPVCMKQFVILLTHTSVLARPEFNNIVLSYCKKVLEDGLIKPTSLYHLVTSLRDIDINVNNSAIIFALAEILLYAPVPRKDQRIADNTILKILKDPIYGCTTEDDIHFPFQIQYTNILILSKLPPEILNTLTILIKDRIADAFKSKQRYHGNSQMHRTLLTSIQHLLYVIILGINKSSVDMLSAWVIELLGRLPHQPSVRLCLEWFIALYFYISKMKLDSNMLQILQSKNVPITSQFIILYWILKRKISKSSFFVEELDFVMNFLLSHTMGQMFNTRLHAQYLASKLFKNNRRISTKYEYTIDIIESTFEESSKDKNFVKLKEDYFVNEFDVVANLNPLFIYYFLPRYYDIGRNEDIDQQYVRRVIDKIDLSGETNECDNDFRKEWRSCRLSNDDLVYKSLHKDINKNKLEISEPVGTLQKKYIPWKDMSDIDTYKDSKKKESGSDLIVVASLIDKLPNLGGMARTCEVFGVKTYVVDSLRHRQDRQFQGLSVSAERWVDMQEVRPGALKAYLFAIKDKGYSIVAAEQTSTSVPLQKFRFPKKTVLMLGHEKEGIPCDLLPLMDHCVEVPQQGFVRSLNVHVTAAIFVWEYSRQNIL